MVRCSLRGQVMGTCGSLALTRQGRGSTLDYMQPPSGQVAHRLRACAAGALAPIPPWRPRSVRPRLPAWTSNGVVNWLSLALARASSQK